MAEYVHENVVDADNIDITIGARVKLEYMILGGEVGSTANPMTAFGKVTEITDIDGDVDDYGRTVMQLPEVIVEFDDGEVDSFNTHWLGRYQDDDAPFQCDDLTVVKETV